MRGKQEGERPEKSPFTLKSLAKTAVNSMTLAQKTPEDPSPPKARRAEQARVIHSVELNDEYAWLKAENWREVLRDPEKLPDPIRRHLQAENGYSAHVLAPIKGLRRELVREMRARLKEDDSEA